MSRPNGRTFSVHAKSGQNGTNKELTSDKVADTLRVLSLSVCTDGIGGQALWKVAWPRVLAIRLSELGSGALGWGLGHFMPNAFAIA